MALQWLSPFWGDDKVQPFLAAQQGAWWLLASVSPSVKKNKQTKKGVIILSNLGSIHLFPTSLVPA